MKYFRLLITVASLFLVTEQYLISAEERARDLGIPFDGEPGKFNAITDVPGVTVGYATIIKDKPKVARTGVSAIFPRGMDSFSKPVVADWVTLNGNGEMTGTTWVRDSGLLEGPIMVTNTHNVGIVHHSIIKWAIENGKTVPSLPVVGETWDGFLNDINAQNVQETDVYKAIESATTGRIAEGSVGSGTGMICYKFKGGIGTSSRKIKIGNHDYIVGVWVQANHGLREELIIAGKPVGKMLGLDNEWKKDSGSIIIVIATDAPLLQMQLNRVARRAALGLARTGSIAHNSSGDIFIAFSTANLQTPDAQGFINLKAIPNDDIDPVFTATVQATEEAIINALVAGRDMTGVNGFTVPGLPNDLIKEMFKSDNVLVTMNTSPEL